jgi:hypothetical protein
MKKIWLSVLVLLLFSCKKDKPPVKDDNTVSGHDVAVVCNEGNFMLGNASLSKIDISTGLTDNDVYYNANGLPLGDVCQSVYFGTNRAYIVVNNSQKIVACNPDTWQTEFTITGFNSPRYFCQVTPGKAYVTELYSGQVNVVDLATKTITGYVACPGWSEEILVSGQYAFVTRPNASYIKVINIFTDLVTDSIQTGYGPNSIVEDMNGKIWVLCNGNSVTGEVPKLVRINPATLQVENTFSFASAGMSPVALTINRTYDTLVYLNNGVYTLPINASIIPSVATITQPAGSSFYGIDVHPYNGHLFVTDALDYVQSGKVYRYKINGTLLSTYTVGYIPNQVYFP